MNAKIKSSLTNQIENSDKLNHSYSNTKKVIAITVIICSCIIGMLLAYHGYILWNVNRDHSLFNLISGAALLEFALALFAVALKNNLCNDTISHGNTTDNGYYKYLRYNVACLFSKINNY